jgi:class 3 adenylate cyclase/Tfp pilus assembly protein PilF
MFFSRKINYTLLYFLFILSLGINAQDQKIADSLTVIYKENNLRGVTKLKLLRDLSFNEKRDLQLALKYADELISLSKFENNDEYLTSGYYRKGSAHQQLGNIEQAIEAFYNSSKIAIKSDNTVLQGLSYMSIADAYSIIQDYKNSEVNYIKAIELLRKTEDSVSLASALNNAGDAFFNNKKFDTALRYFEESGIIFKKMDYVVGNAYSLGNTGMVQASQGKDSLALININKAINILEDLEDYYPISVYLTILSDIYANKENWDQAFTYTEMSLDLALKYGLKDQVSEAYLQLSELHENHGMPLVSLENYKQHIIYRDSVSNIETVREMADLRTDYEVAQKQVEVDLLNEQKKNQRIVVISTAVALLLIGVLAVGLYRRNKYISYTKNLIEYEKQRSDNLLLNILPEETAEELKNNGKVQAKRFDSVSVMFTDFIGFTAYSDKLSPEELVESVDYYYSKFDEIIEKFGLEKIKTVGDAYMCAGGLPFPIPDHALKMVEAAIEIASFVKESKISGSNDQTRFDIRIGINTGPVVAGVVGTKKFTYDIWGDAVNIASRMESNSESGKINISENTYQLIREDYNCTYRGEVEVKNKGKMKMYFVETNKVKKFKGV